MQITSIALSVFELPSNTGQFDLVEEIHGARRRWVRRHHGSRRDELHVLHVRTDEGIEGISTVGDARYTKIRREDLQQLRILTLGENPLNRERLNSKLHAATRGMFAKPGWFGAFDNCLWDIAGKAAGLPVWALLGRARDRCPAYYNYGGDTEASTVVNALAAVELGFPALKDHFSGPPRENIARCEAVRAAVGPEVDLLHDAVLANYGFGEAVEVGHALEDLGFGWIEEPLPDAELVQLQRLCSHLDLPVMALETLMHDHVLSAQYLLTGATDLIRANARHGTTGVLKLAHLAQAHGTTVELNGPGGLFGLIHAHLACAIRNTQYYEYFPGGSRDEAGKAIGLLNPSVPVDGHIVPPDGPGWGAEWDFAWFERQRVTINR
ncbi:MAG: enolase C-terminal domain-like protein [Anaerolineae bacterium]